MGKKHDYSWRAWRGQYTPHGSHVTKPKPGDEDWNRVTFDCREHAASGVVYLAFSPQDAKALGKALIKAAKRSPR